MSDGRTDTPKIVLAGVFITGLITAQLVAVKLLDVPFPDAVPVVGDAVLVPAGVVAYAVTFLASDCYVELYGKRPTQVMINTAFGMNFVMLALVWLAILLPGSQAGVDPAAFETVLGLSTNVVIGSLAAYLVSQNWDVVAFHAIGDRTDGRHLWLRNLASTGTSQLIDTVMFVTVTFFIVPQVLGIGDVLSMSLLVELIVGQYLIKLLIALLDTPIVYAVVGYVRSTAPVESRRVIAD
jgi:uncharacterized integral membrane protein (TIGR00697 family)